jgi:hypothetical protein
MWLNRKIGRISWRKAMLVLEVMRRWINWKDREEDLEKGY